MEIILRVRPALPGEDYRTSLEGPCCLFLAYADGNERRQDLVCGGGQTAKEALSAAQSLIGIYGTEALAFQQEQKKGRKADPGTAGAVFETFGLKPIEPACQSSTKEDAQWRNDDIQFPRLLSAIFGTQNLEMGALAEAMGLTITQVEELFNRAYQVREGIKAGFPVGLEAVMKEGKIGVLPDPMDGWVARSFGDATKFTGATPLAAARSCWQAGQPKSGPQLIPPP